MMLPFNVSRCAGRKDFLPDTKPCVLRNTYMRYLSLIRHPPNEPIYVPVVMMTDDDGACEYYVGERYE